MITINKGIPIPTANGGRAITYPFEDMEVGDSFFVEGKTSDQLTNAAAHYRKKNGWGFSARNVEESVDDIKKKGARIWRTK
jgi:hypothetical protein